jgi:RIO kinase 1
MDEETDEEFEKTIRNDKHLDEKREKKIDREIQHIINRIGLDRKTQDEVFDKSTLLSIEKLISDKVIDHIDFPISTGKEGNVFRAVTPQKEYVAIKIYRTSTLTFKHISQYITGDPRFESYQKKNRREVINLWTKKEFINLEKLLSAGIKAPRPITKKNNILVMEYLGNYQKSAPLMKDVKLENPDEIFLILINYIKKMHDKIRLVHSDMSPYNILIHNKEPYIIDLGQAVLLDHPNAKEFLKRDIQNIVSYFKKYKILSDENQILNDIISKEEKI